MLYFGQDSITVILKWTSEDSVSYNVRVVPEVDVIFNGTECVQLMLTYNMLYTVSLEATQCGGDATSTTIELNYSKPIDLATNFSL